MPSSRSARMSAARAVLDATRGAGQPAERPVVEDDDLAVAREADVELGREPERARAVERGERVLGAAVARIVQPPMRDRPARQPAFTEFGGSGRDGGIVRSAPVGGVKESPTANCTLTGSTLVYESRGRRRGPMGKEDAVPEVTYRERGRVRIRSHTSRGGRA